MRTIPHGTRSTTKPSARGRPKTREEVTADEITTAMETVMTIPTQEPRNKRTKVVYMAVKLTKN
mgnify:CR=1 FL=1